MFRSLVEFVKDQVCAVAHVLHRVADRVDPNHCGGFYNARSEDGTLDLLFECEAIPVFTVNPRACFIHFDSFEDWEAWHDAGQLFKPGYWDWVDGELTQ